MSTTFEIYPGTEYIPSIEETVELAQSYIDEYIKRFDIRRKFIIEYYLKNEDGETLDLKVGKNNLEISKHNYYWLSIKDISGGADLYYEQVDIDITKRWEEELSLNTRVKQYSKNINKTLEIGHFWVIRRSVGQSAIVNLMFGMVAAAISKLTNGFIYSNDGAWDIHQFPTNAEDFLLWYFNPDYLDNSNDDKKWAKDNLDMIRKDNL